MNTFSAQNITVYPWHIFPDTGTVKKKIKLKVFVTATFPRYIKPDFSVMYDVINPSGKKTLNATIHNNGNIPVNAAPVRFLAGGTVIGDAPSRKSRQAQPAQPQSIPSFRQMVCT